MKLLEISLQEYLKLRESVLDIEVPDNVKDAVWMLYEWEIKYHWINQATRMNPVRKERTLELIEKRLWPVIDYLKGVFVKLFSVWLTKHVLNPDKWASIRVLDDIDLAGLNNNLASNSPARLAEFLQSDVAGQYAYQRMMEIHGVDHKEKATPDFLFDNLQEFVQKSIDVNFEILRPIWKVEMQQDYLSMGGMNSEDEEDTGELDDGAIKAYIEEASDYEFDVILKGLNSAKAAQVVLNCYAKVIFPVWYDVWSHQDLLNTIKRIQKALARLKLVNPSMYLKDSFMTLNIAINSAHQTGDMISYLDRFVPEADSGNLSKADLKALSELGPDTISKWKKDLTEMGVW